MIARLPWAIFAVATLMSVTGIVLLVLAPDGAIRAGNSLPLQALFAGILVVFGLVGAVVASRLPSNPIGWLFLALAALDGVFELSFGYASYALADPPPTVPWAAWVSNWTGPLSPPFLIAALLLFPDGRPPTSRWQWILWLSGAIGVLVLGRYALAPGPIGEFPSLQNPAGLDGARWLADVPAESLYAVGLAGAAAALAVRFRRSHGVERQQVKWLAFAASVIVGFLVVGSVFTALGEDSDSVLAGFVFAACLCGVPIAAGMAILRHRLYDIDLVIRRTLAYGGVTALLATTYLGLVLLAGLAVGDSDIAVAASTLAVAALFRPALARIQAAVDRRFYRRHYDVALTLEAFGARLRNELDLETVGGDLRGVVRETVQPAHVSLWLRGRR